jgi:hypothetical protein
MKIMSVRAFSVLILFSFFVSCKGQNTGISEKDLQKLFKQEKWNEDRAKYGDNKTKIVVISEANEVNRIGSWIDKRIEEKTQENLQRLTDKTLPERYKSGDKSVVKQIIVILNGNDTKAKHDIYYGLSRNYDEPEDYSISEHELIETILQSIQRDEDEESVVQLAGSMRLPGYAQAFENRLLSGKSHDIDRLVFWLGYDGKSIKTLDYVSDLILNGKINLEEQYYVMSGLENFAQYGDTQVKNRVFELCLDIYNRKIIRKERFEEIKKVWSSDNPATGLIDVLFASSDKRVIPIAAEFFEKGISTDAALNALIRIEGDKHKDKVLDLLNDKDKYFDGLDPAVTLYRKTNDKSIAEQILVNFQKRKESADHETDRVVNALTEMGATEYFGKLEEILKDKELINSLRQSYELTKGRVEDVASDLYQMGVVDKPFAGAIIEKAKKKSEGDESQGYLFNFLSVSGIFMWFDAEVGMVPVDYDELLKSLTKNSNGKFENIGIWMDARSDASDKVEYYIYLKANNRIYVAHPEDIGDWYDVEAVLQLLNTALADSGLKERYVFIDTGDQTVQIMFGPEENVNAFAKKYGL